MSCIKCDEAQEIVEFDSTDELAQRVHTFVRVGKANVLISGCEEHLGELIQKLRGTA